jgi:hypothetical protein
MKKQKRSFGIRQNYEILHKDAGAEISDYWMRYASCGGMESISIYSGPLRCGSIREADTTNKDSCH